MEIYTDSAWECPTVLAESNTLPLPQTLIHNDVPVNTECWGVGCDITVKRQKTDTCYDSDLEYKLPTVITSLDSTYNHCHQLKLPTVITSLNSTYNHCHQLCFSSKY